MLTYEMGGLYRLNTNLSLPHKFAVEGLEGKVRLHAGFAHFARDLVRESGFNVEDCIGGGQFSMISSVLTLYASSMDYGGIPVKAAEQFAPLLKKALEERGVDVQGVRATTSPIRLHEYWLRNLSVL